MSVLVQTLSLLLAEHKRDPFMGPVLTYGVQGMNLPLGAATWLFEHAGITPDVRGLDLDRGDDEIINFARFVRMLGLGDVTVLDISAYEGAGLLLNLNDPLPEAHHGKFGFVLDGGTLEHVFDMRQGIKNTADLLAPGGRVYHLSPLNNYVNHGFTQIQPTFYHDYYTANGFEDIRGLLVLHPRDNYSTQKWNFINYDHEVMGGTNSMFAANETQMALYFTARKTVTSTSDKVPVQSYFARFNTARPMPEHRFDVRHSVTEPLFDLVPPPPAEIAVPIHTIVV